jgi:signal transduction histidine kinase/CheY-like chemotaxis protein
MSDGPLMLARNAFAWRASPLWALFSLGLIHLIDRNTPAYITLNALYTVPVMIAAWGLGRPGASAMALLATGSWIYVSFQVSGPFTSTTSLAWCSLTLFAGFLVPGLIVDALKRRIESERQLRLSKESAESQAAELAERFRTLFSAIPTPVLEFDCSGWSGAFRDYRQQGIQDLGTRLAAVPEDARRLTALMRCLDENPAALALLGPRQGPEQAPPMAALLEHGGGALPAAMAALYAGRRRHVQEIALTDVEGQRRHLLLDLSVLPGHEQGLDRVLVILTDLTRQVQANEEKAKLLIQLKQSQKMESLGTLAGGVAHDMNNVLGAILGLASAHLEQLPDGSPLHHALDTIVKATERGGRMVKSLLGFARQSPAENSKVDVNALLREQVSLLERTTLAKVHLEMDLEAGLGPIQGDPSALTHAFMNLCVNAVDAMAENGTLTLHTRNLAPGWIEVVVEDDGAGMPAEILEKAMDPFFTTKEVGKGTGLGLSTVHSTVKAHRGQLELESEPGKGTRVRLRFPTCAPAPLAPLDPAWPEPPPLPGGLKVLLVDDDELIHDSVQAILETLGHPTVTTALSGEEALTLLAAGYEPDLVILDMNMPGLGGAGTLPRLRDLRPQVPVLLSTGRTDQSALNLAALHPGVTMLPKPFGLRQFQKHLEGIGLG